MELLNDSTGTSVEITANCLKDSLVLDVFRPKRGQANGNGLRDADGVAKLNLKPIRGSGGNKIFSNVTRVIGGGTVHFGRVFPRESSTAMPRASAIGIDNEFPPRKAGVSSGASDFKSPRRIDEGLEVVIKAKTFRNGDHDFIVDEFFEFIHVDAFIMLNRHQNGVVTL